jgi:AcrR family transcriptional regulator
MLAAVTTSAARRTQVRQSREEVRARIIAAAGELLRTRSFAELTVDDVMRAAGQGRTVFYRHFDDLPDLLRRSSREAVDALYAAQEALTRDITPGEGNVALRSLRPAVAVYARHGPLLRGVVEAAASDPEIALALADLRARFEDLAAAVLAPAAAGAGGRLADPRQSARALNLMNESYLLDAFGRAPRVDPEVAARTLAEIWTAIATPNRGAA